MSEISTEVGKRIRYFRMSRNMTIEELAAAVYKSKATISKYEKGDIVMDIETLYEIANRLHVHVDQLLVSQTPHRVVEHEVNPSFFRDVNRFVV